jgi:DegV family protein with EDD domain
MLPETAIVTDSVACLTKELIEQYAIEIIPLNILVGGKVYRDWIDISPSTAYELVLKDPDSFKTSPATPEECLEVFRKASRKSKDIVCITVSSGISALSNMAAVAQERARTILPSVRIEIIDSETATSAEGFVALAAARAALTGASFKDVVVIAQQVKYRVHTVVLLDTIRYVYRSGRIPRIAAQAASILSIKPIFTITGKVRFATAVVSKKHGIERILKMMHDEVGQNPVHCAVMHAYAPDEAIKLKERVASEFNTIELWISEFSPVMGYATGTGTLGVAFYHE